MARSTPIILPLHKNEASQPQTSGTASRPYHIPNKWRNELVAMAAEFAGTFMFLFFAFGGTQIANNAATSYVETTGQNINSPAPNTSVLLYISLSFGFSLMVNVWIFFRVTGGMFNPAVTLALFLIGAVKPTRACLCFISQMLAGMCSAAVISAILPGPLKVSTNLAAGVSIARGLFLEMFLTALLVMTIYMLAVEKHKATYLAPIGIGMALFMTQMVGVFYTGGSLNPTRSFGPCVATRDFPGYHYIYWIGPCMGALLAFGMYKIVKSVQYETVNPGQDFDDHEAALFHPPNDPARADQVERPNVAAIVAEEAVRMANHSSDGREPLLGIKESLSEEGHVSPIASRLSELGRTGQVGGSHGVND